MTHSRDRTGPTQTDKKLDKKKTKPVCETGAKLSFTEMLEIRRVMGGRGGVRTGLRDCHLMDDTYSRAAYTCSIQHPEGGGGTIAPTADVGPKYDPLK